MPCTSVLQRSFIMFYFRSPPPTNQPGGHAYKLAFIIILLLFKLRCDVQPPTIQKSSKLVADKNETKIEYNAFMYIYFNGLMYIFPAIHRNKLNSYDQLTSENCYYRLTTCNSDVMTASKS